MDREPEMFPYQGETFYRRLLLMISAISMSNPDESLRILAMILKDDIDMYDIYKYTEKSLKENGVELYS